MSNEVSLFPTSFTQERFWFLDTMVPGNPAYNIAFHVDLSGELDLEVLRRALYAVIIRHESLRTVFEAIDGLPCQVIHEPWEPELAFEDLSDLGPAEGMERVKEKLTAAAQEPFDLKTLPLIRFQLFRLEARRHVLTVVVHHIVFDGWSVGVLLKELNEQYQAGVNAADRDAMPELVIQYLDYAVWQKEAVGSDYGQQELKFWQTALKDAPTKLSLTTDFPRPAIQTFQGERHYFKLNRDVSDRLTTLACENGVTLFTSLLSVFQIMIHKYTGKSDFLIGMPIANRQPAEVEELIGCFINMLPFRANISAESSFLDLVKASQENCLRLFANQNMPFDYLVRELRLPRDLSTSPLVQVLFNFQNAVPERISGGELEISQEKHFNQTTQYELTVEIWQPKDGIEGYFEYNASLFRPETIARMTEHFITLLERALEQPDKAVTNLSLLTKGEWDQQILCFNETVAPLPAGTGVHNLFEAQALKTPDRVAAVFEDEHLTYWELNARANQLADYLIEKSGGTVGYIGLCLNRSLEMLTALLAVLKSGAAYIPLDPAYPQERLDYMISHSGLKLLIMDEKTGRAFEQKDVEKILLSETLAELTARSTEDHQQQIDQQQPAYVIYTSGSTGNPKGVVIPHIAAVNFLLSMQKAPGIDESDVLLAVTTLSFDISVLEMFLPLISGATVAIVPQSILVNGFLLAEEIAESGATVMQATPASWRLLIDAGWQGKSDLKILCGGELLPPELAGELLTRGSELWNLYGPTETTVWSATQQIEAVDGPVSIGRPIDNTGIYILDAEMNPVPVGVDGELYIGGKGLAAGYLHQPELTAERFLESELANGLIYRTGDLARFRPDGTINIVGRIDHQVKIRGFRIELGEIESRLLACEGVKEAVVTARGNEQHDRRLAAYLISEASVPLSVEKIRQELTKTLPVYMIPADICQLEALPKTPNNKIDRKALPDPASLGPGMDKASDLRGETEERLAELWRSVLGDMVIASDDNFFNLGGHSLLAMKTLSDIEKEFGLRISPQVLVMQTLRQLARQCEVALAEKPSENRDTGFGRKLFSKIFKT